eukprot:TRINITY_DN8528_c0_g3_i1.p1 TRINITY_DN8528_c0_g3~~TRINITY_DN8528_c0_g3_i1.p1  ORF type:complete len:204 (-),score=76.62 TRINITY_DN8528_c0_g3_i1:50-661(-)
MGILKVMITWKGNKVKTIEFSGDSEEAKLETITVQEFKEIVKDRFGYSKIMEAKIYFNGKELMNDDVMSTKGVINESNLIAIIEATELKTVNVVYKKKKKNVSVHIDGCIKDLKKAIAEQLGIPQTIQIFKMDNNVLDHDYISKLNDKKEEEEEKEANKDEKKDKEAKGEKPSKLTDKEFELISLAEAKIVEGSVICLELAKP